jgi:DNA-binding NarL/FixJ family response regulator
MDQPTQAVKRVLVVDDDSALADLICEVLNTSGGIAAEHLGDGEAALAAWKAARPDLLIVNCLERFTYWLPWLGAGSAANQPLSSGSRSIYLWRDRFNPNTHLTLQSCVSSA